MPQLQATTNEKMRAEYHTIYGTIHIDSSYQIYHYSPTVEHLRKPRLVACHSLDLDCAQTFILWPAKKLAIIDVASSIACERICIHATPKPMGRKDAI